MAGIIMIPRGTDEKIEMAAGTFSFPCLFFGPFWFAWKRMFGAAALAALGVILTLGWGWLALPLFANRLHRRFLLRQGFVEADQPSVPTDSPRARSYDPEIHQNAVQMMYAEAAQSPVDTSYCMECHAREGLEPREFGFARIAGVDYGATAASAGLSAVSMILGGPGMIQGPKTTASILRTQLVLCRACLKRRKNVLGIPTIKDVDYAMHPWAAAAQRHGFTQHFNEYELRRYRRADPNNPRIR